MKNLKDFKATINVLDQKLKSNKSKINKYTNELKILQNNSIDLKKKYNEIIKNILNDKITIGYLELCIKNGINEDEENFTFSKNNPKQYNLDELLGVIIFKRNYLRKYPKMLLQKDPNYLYISKYSIMKEKNNILIFNDKDSDENNSDIEFDPFVPLCPFELQGKCNDDKCPYQHLQKKNAINKINVKIKYN